MRLLLLARDGGEWWDNLPGKDTDCEAFLGGYATSGPYPLSTLHTEIQDRREAYQRALHAFAQVLRVPSPNVVPELTGEHFGRPLYLHMAALLALHGERPTTAQGLTKALLNHERRYWRGSLAGGYLPEPERYAEQLLALATLAGGFPTPKAAQRYWSKASGNALSTAAFGQLFHALVPLYPGKQGLQAVRPDLLGEALVAQALLRSTAPDLLDAVLASDASQPVRRHALTVLARLSGQHYDLHETLVESLVPHFAHCCHDIVAVATETTSDLPGLAEAAFLRVATNVKNQVAGLLKSHVNEESVQLSGFYCLVLDSLVAKYREKLKKKSNDVEFMSDYAGALGNHAVALYRIGRDDQALEPARQALEIFQRLAQKDPACYDPSFASSLSNYAGHLSDAGQYEEALKHARQALEIRQRLAQKNPDRYEPDFATSLNNYANHLCDTGQEKKSLEPAWQALEIRRRLAQKNPDRYEPDFATSLDNYASHLRDAEKDEAALEPARQALEIRRRLAQKNPDRYKPDFVTSLSNYARHLSDAGQEEAALEPARQALEIHRRLAQKTPARFAETLFSSSCLTQFLGWLNSDGDASNDGIDWNSVQASVPVRRHSRSLLYQAFVQACLASKDPAACAQAFKRVIALWGDLSQADRNTAQDYWLCAAAWCTRFDPSAVENLDWRANWHRYVSRRKGRLPHWMQKLAQRLAFQWPE